MAPKAVVQLAYECAAKPTILREQLVVAIKGMAALDADETPLGGGEVKPGAAKLLSKQPGDDGSPVELRVAPLPGPVAAP